MDVVIDSDEWVVLRVAELRQKGERAQIRVVVENNRIVDVYVLRSNGVEERRTTNMESFRE